MGGVVMPLLWDRVQREVGISGVEVIEASNVVDYYSESEKDNWSWYSDLPNLAPPFERFWVEAKTPKSIVTKDGRIDRPSDVVDRSGALFIARKFEHGGWGMIITPFVYERSIGVIRQRMIATIELNEDGSFRGDGERGILVVAPNDVVARFADGALGCSLPEYVDGLVKPLSLAICFMHCKNVHMEEVIPPTPLSKKWQKKGNDPLVRYKTLQIEPMRKIIDRAREENNCGLPKAMHICRGHFKDYRGHGLFGKYKGMYWWDQHVRGDAKEGIVLKNYKINAPEVAS
jgi:hypothetical protein